MDKPTLREKIAGVERKLDDFNARYGRSDKLCHFCRSRKYDGRNGIIHTPDCLILTLRSYPNLIKEELKGLEVIGDRDIIDALGFNPNKEYWTESDWDNQITREIRKVIRAQLSHTIKELKERLDA